MRYHRDVEPCPSEDMLQRFLDGDGDRAVVETHVSRCSACSSLVAHLVRGLPAGTAVTTPLDEEVPVPGSPEQIDRYRILARVGVGGMGVVYAAYDPQLDRKVALKLLHRRGAGVEQRLLREARAMARLDHVNVVPVFDVGEYAGQAFVAMAFVDGTTLRTWLATSRTWREILTAFIAAGDGLAAAHGAGIIHRDFKPDNVLVDGTGRVRVTDFGLARSAAVADAVGSDAVLDDTAVPLTREGAILGTPAYMAPEQIAGEEVDVRSDVFAFCVALWEALYGELPFAIDRKLGRGPLRTPPSDRQVPRRIHHILLAGLELEREARTATMHAVLDALRSHVARRRRWVAVGASAVVAVGVVGVVAWGARDTEAVCTDGAAHVATLWSADVRARTLVALGAARLAPIITALDVRFERLRETWTNEYVSACRATRVSRVQSERVLDRRLQCLDDVQRRWRSGIDALSTSRSPVKSVQALDDLPAANLCADLTRLGETQQLPAVAQLGPVAALQERIVRLDPHAALGEVSPATTDALVVEAKRIGHAPTLARALLVHGAALVHTEPTAGVSALHRAAAIGQELDAPELSAEAWLRLASHHAFNSEPAPALQLVDYAAAMVHRLGDPPDLTMRLAVTRGDAYMAAFAYEKAEQLHHEVVDYRRRTAPGSLAEASATNRLAIVLAEQGKQDEARDLFARALEIREQVLGPDHVETLNLVGNVANLDRMRGRPELAVAQLERMIAAYRRSRTWQPLANAEHNLSIALFDLGRYAEAQTAIDEALRLEEEIFGRDSEALVSSLVNAAEVAGMLGQSTTAYAHIERGLAILAKRGPHAPELARFLTVSGGAARRLRDTRVARRYYALALEEFEYANEGARSPTAASAHDGAAWAAQASGDLDEAIAHSQRSIEIRVASLGPRHPTLSTTYAALAESLLARGQAGDVAGALAAAERAVALAEKTPDRVYALVHTARARFALNDGAGAKRAADEARALIARTPAGIELWAVGRLLGLP